MVTAATTGMVPPVLPLVVRQWALTPVQAGLVNTCQALGRLLGTYPTAHLRARRGPRATALAGTAALGLGGALCAAAPVFGLFLLGRLVTGLGISGTFLAAFAELLESAPAPARGRLANGFEGLAILSLAVGGLLAGGLARLGGWRGAFAGTAGVALGGLAAAARLRAVPPGAPPPRGVTAGHRAPRTRLAPVYGAAFALAFTWSGLFVTLAPLVGAGRHRLGEVELGWALGAGYLAELAGLAAVATVIDRWRREPLFLAGAATAAAGAFLTGAAQGRGGFVIGLVLTGAGFAVWMVPATVLADRAGTPLAAGPLAAFRTALDAGMILGPVVVGALLGTVSDRGAALAAGAVLLAGGLALARR